MGYLGHDGHVVGLLCSLMLQKMPKKVKCCVPGCGNNYKTQGSLHFYRIPKDVDIRNAYRLLLRNHCVRLDSENTRICSAHFESGLKLSRCHLPNIFPWNNDEDEKTGEKRKNLEHIASILKTKRAKNELSEEQLRDRVQGYQYHVPWRFDGVPLHHGVISSFKTLEEHEQSRTVSVSSADNQINAIEREETSFNASINTTNNPTQHSLRFHPLSSVDAIYTPVNKVNMSTDSRQMTKVSMTLGTLSTPIKPSLSNNNWQIRPSYTHSVPSTSAVIGPSNQQSLMKAVGSNQILHVDQNFFKPGVVTSKQENGIGVQILNNSQTSLVNDANLEIQNRKSSTGNHQVIGVQEKLEVHQSQNNFPFSNGNNGQILSNHVNHTKIHKEMACQTDVSEEDFQQMVKRINGMRYENRNLKEEVDMLKKKLQKLENVQKCPRFNITKLENKELTFYTGFENLESLMFFLNIVKESAKILPVWGKILRDKLSGEDSETDEELNILGELSLFFMKVKSNLSNTDLAYRFAVTENKVQSIIYTWLQIFYAFSSGSPVYQQLPTAIQSGLRNYGIV